MEQKKSPFIAQQGSIQVCRVESGAINRQVLVVVVFQIRAHSTQVPSSHQASSSTGFSCQMKTYDFHLLLAFLRSAGECTEGTYQDDDYG